MKKANLKKQIKKKKNQEIITEKEGLNSKMVLLQS